MLFLPMTVKPLVMWLGYLHLFEHLLCYSGEQLSFLHSPTVPSSYIFYSYYYYNGAYGTSLKVPCERVGKSYKGNRKKPYPATG